MEQIGWSRILTAILALLYFRVATASNILVWSPTFGHSHVAFLGNIADVLTADGHNVTILSPMLDPHVNTFGNRLPAHTIRIGSNSSTKNDWLNLEFKSSNVWNTPPCDGMCIKWSDFDIMVEQTYRICRTLLEDNELLNSLRSTKFALVFSEAIDGCGPGIFEILNVTSAVMVSALGMMSRLYDISGLKPLPSFVPVGLAPYSDEMSFVERMNNFNLHVMFAYYGYRVDYRFWKMFNEKFPGFPTIAQICFEKTALIMINAHEFAETPRPTTNMVRYIGGVTVYKPKPLSKLLADSFSSFCDIDTIRKTCLKELDDILSQRNATVLFCMGSLAQSRDMPLPLKKALIKSFKSLRNITFIWKYEDSDHSLFEDAPNILPMAWVPQNDLLGDRRLSLFITHGGMNSVMEAMHHGKPMIVIPLFADQQLNAKIVARRKLGIVLEKHQMNANTMTAAIRSVIENRSIAKGCTLVASLLAGRPEQYRQDVAKFARLIIQHEKLEHLPLYSRNMNFAQYFSLDVIAFEVSVVFAVAFLCTWLTRRVLHGLSKNKKKSD